MEDQHVRDLVGVGFGDEHDARFDGGGAVDLLRDAADFEDRALGGNVAGDGDVGATVYWERKESIRRAKAAPAEPPSLGVYFSSKPKVKRAPLPGVGFCALM